MTNHTILDESGVAADVSMRWCWLEFDDRRFTVIRTLFCRIFWWPPHTPTASSFLVGMVIAGIVLRPFTLFAETS